jgi:hypothetical protein
MDNIAAGMANPIVMDLKMGTLTYGPDATVAKIDNRIKKDNASTIASLGLMVVGARLPRDQSCSSTDDVGEKLGGAMHSEEEVCLPPPYARIYTISDHHPSPPHPTRLSLYDF